MADNAQATASQQPQAVPSSNPLQSTLPKKNSISISGAAASAGKEIELVYEYVENRLNAPELAGADIPPLLYRKDSTTGSGSGYIGAGLSFADGDSIDFVNQGSKVAKLTKSDSNGPKKLLTQEGRKKRREQHERRVAEAEIKRLRETQASGEGDDAGADGTGAGGAGEATLSPSKSVLNLSQKTDRNASHTTGPTIPSGALDRLASTSQSNFNNTANSGLQVPRGGNVEDWQSDMSSVQIGPNYLNASGPGLLGASAGKNDSGTLLGFSRVPVGSRYDATGFVLPSSSSGPLPPLKLGSTTVLGGRPPGSPSQLSPSTRLNRALSPQAQAHAAAQQVDPASIHLSKLERRAAKAAKTLNSKSAELGGGGGQSDTSAKQDADKRINEFNKNATSCEGMSKRIMSGVDFDPLSAAAKMPKKADDKDKQAQQQKVQKEESLDIFASMMGKASKAVKKASGESWKKKFIDMPDPTGQFSNQYERVCYFRSHKKLETLELPPLSKENLCPPWYSQWRKNQFKGSVDVKKRNQSWAYLSTFLPENKKEHYKSIVAQWEEKNERFAQNRQYAADQREAYIWAELARRNIGDPGQAVAEEAEAKKMKEGADKAAKKLISFVYAVGWAVELKYRMEEEKMQETGLTFVTQDADGSASMNQTGISIRQRTFFPVMLSDGDRRRKLEGLYAIQKFRSAVRRVKHRVMRENKAEIVFQSLKMWSTGAILRKFIFCISRFMQVTRRIQKFWRVSRKRINQALRDSVKEALQAEQRHHLNTLNNRRGSGSGTNKGIIGPDHVLSASDIHRIDTYMLESREREFYCKIELRTRRYLNIASLNLWQEAMRDYREEVASWRSAVQAIKVLGQDEPEQAEEYPPAPLPPGCPRYLPKQSEYPQVVSRYLYTHSLRLGQKTKIPEDNDANEGGNEEQQPQDNEDKSHSQSYSVGSGSIDSRKRSREHPKLVVPIAVEAQLVMRNLSTLSNKSGGKQAGHSKSHAHHHHHHPGATADLSNKIEQVLSNSFTKLSLKPDKEVDLEIPDLVIGPASLGLRQY